MLENLPSMQFCMICYGASALVAIIVAAIFKTRIRVIGAPSWLLLAILAPIPTLAAKPLVAAVGLPATNALPVTALAVFLCLFVVHWVLPAILPDFQTESFPVSMLMAFCIGLVVMGTGFATKDFDSMMGTQTEEVFGKSADLNEKPFGLD
ncbi:hypothetical protein IT571_01120 [Candidatus Sumerlaeota bacterium]|nr:hypothetical protein [Candidatus Sumerlaeota bacterium]